MTCNASPPDPTPDPSAATSNETSLDRGSGRGGTRGIRPAQQSARRVRCRPSRTGIAAATLLTGLLAATTTTVVQPASGETGPTQAPRPSTAPVSVTLGHLRTEAADRPLSIDVAAPRFSWQLGSDKRGVRQHRYELRVATTATNLQTGHPTVWDSGPRRGEQPWASYAGPELRPLQRYYWTVRVQTTTAGRAPLWSSWSRPTWFETAFTRPTQWTAKWIAGPAFTPAAPDACSPNGETIRTEACTPPSPLMRTQFQVNKPVAKARLYASGLGYGVYFLNGRRTSDAVLDPGFTDYTKRAYYVVHDVTRDLRRGTNALGAELGRGIYGQQSYNFAGYQAAPWHSDPELRLELHITYTDGTTTVVRSDPSWKVTDGPSRFDDLMRGENYDAQRAAALTGWSTPGYDDSGWQPARTTDGPTGHLVAQNVEPVRPSTRLPFKSVKQTGPDRYLFDLGQEVAGSVILNGDIATGVPITLHYGEKLDDTGSVDTAMIPGPYGFYFGQLQKDVYIGRAGRDHWRPEFSYKGFRYVEVSGLTAAPAPSLLTAEVWHNDVRTIGTWHSSSTLLNRIVGNTRRAVLNNMFWQPTDTPIYEKTGYTGDGQLMTGANNYLFDMHRFYTKWSEDVAEAQNPATGELLGITAPTAAKPGDGDGGWPGPSPGWDVALFNVPDSVRNFTGDARPEMRDLSEMKTYIKYIGSFTDANGVIHGQCQTLTGPNPCTNGLGDWSTVSGMPYGVSLDSTAWYYEMLRILGNAAKLGGDQATVASAHAEMRRVKAGFNKEFWDESIHGYRNDPAETDLSQHQQAIALGLGLVPADRIRTVANTLSSDAQARGDHLSTGIMGTRFLFGALTQTGHLDEALKIATQTTYPSYGYWIDKLGWTALGENWEADTRSRSHMMFGTIVQWLYQDLAGYRPTAAGWSRIQYKPEIPSRGLDHVSASTDTVRGTVATSWRRTTDGLTVTITVPAGSTGQVSLPAKAPANVREGGSGHWLRADQAPGVRLIGKGAGRVLYRVGSGTYRFSVTH